MSKLSWEKTSNLQRKSSFMNGNIDFKEVFLRITPDRTPGSETTNVVRLISQPYAYYVHWANKKEPGGTKLIKENFPDSEFTKKPTRNCSTQITENGVKEDPNCPWCKLGYSRQLRFMINVISRDNNKVMILDAPMNVINDISAWVEGAQEEGLDNVDPSAWDKPAPDFRIKAVRKNGGSIEWTTTSTNKLKKLTEEDLKLIRAINPEAETDEEALTLYPLEMFVKPTPLITEGYAKNSDNDDNEEEVAARPMKRDTSESKNVLDPYSDSDDIDDDEEIEPIKIRSTDDDDDDDDDDW